MDKISIDRIGLAHPSVRKELSDILREANDALTGMYKLRYTWTLRTAQQQADLYAQGRTRPGKIVTNAIAGMSWHNYGLAVDICLYNAQNRMAVWDTISDFDSDKKADWMEIVALFKARGWEWGGDWADNKRDKPHFEKTFGLSIREALNRSVRHKTAYVPL